MAGGLPKSREQFHKIPNARVAIIASMWHPKCVDAMIDRAKRELTAAGMKESKITVHRLPGSMELPYAARALFETQPELDAIIAFGVVLKGATTHDAAVIHQVLQGFNAVTERFGKPIINEVIGVSDIKDAEQRSGESDLNKGLEAVFALTELLHWRKSLSSGGQK